MRDSSRTWKTNVVYHWVQGMRRRVKKFNGNKCRIEKYVLEEGVGSQNQKMGIIKWCIYDVPTFKWRKYEVSLGDDSVRMDLGLDERACMGGWTPWEGEGFNGKPKGQLTRIYGTYLYFLFFSARVRVSRILRQGFTKFCI
ncbi:hypothetical protein RUM44_000491 [Polyplax serrata]|uniref:Uncharacterized protein n=1 Tax=Polyplax serrata TaxID=468196 RepID=A0ABR1B5K6_POLSC